MLVQNSFKFKRLLTDNQVNLINTTLSKYTPKQLVNSVLNYVEMRVTIVTLDILIPFAGEGKSPWSLLELLSLEESLEKALGFPVEIINEQTIKSPLLKTTILNRVCL